MALTDVKSEQIQSSVALAGSPTTTTQSASDNSTKIATTAYVETAVANLVASAPSALNTLDELAAALNDDASFSTTVTNSIATKLPLAGGTMTGGLGIGAAVSTGYQLQLTGQSGYDDILRLTAVGTNIGARINLTNTGTGVARLNATNNSLALQTAGISALTLDSSQNATFAGTGTFAGGAANNNDDANILTLNASQHARLLVDTSSTSGHRATLALESNGNELTLATTGSASYLNSVGNLELTGGIVTIVPDTGATTGTLRLHNGNGNGTLGQLDFGYSGSAHHGSIAYTGNMDFYTGGSGTSRMTINSSGNVGIGTSSPGAALDIETAGNTADGTYYSTITINNTGSSTYSRLRFDRSGSARWGVGLRNDDKFHITKLFNTASDDIFVIDSGGKVGIGENTPLGKLHIKEGDSGQGSVNSNFDQLVLEDDQHSGMTILSGASHDGGIYFGDSGGNNLGQFKYRHSNNSFRFITNNGSDAMVIDSSGNVGIGTDPSYKLHVSGESSIGDFSANGFANLGRNADGNQDVTTLGGYGVDAGSGTRYGRYGALRFRSSANYTAGSRGYMITNGYGANKFAILQSSNATTMPSLGSYGGVSGGTAPFIMDNTGDITLGYQPVAYGRITGNPTGPTADYGLPLTTDYSRNITAQTNSTHGPGITITKAGVYIMSMSFLYDPTGNYVYIGWCVNGSIIHHWHSNHAISSNHDGHSSIARYLNVGDHLTIERTTANSMNIYGNTHSYWWVCKVG